MEEVKLEVYVRKEKGTINVRRLRRGNYIPAIIYGEEDGATPLKIDKRIFEKIMRAHPGENVIFHLDIVEESQKTKDYSAISKEIQRHPISHDILHVDFSRISLTKKIEVEVPIETKGEPVGVKKDGGSLEHLLWKLTIVCLPMQIPAHIVVDVSSLNVHESIYVKDIVLPVGVEVKHDPQMRVVTVIPPMKEEAPAVEAAPDLEVIKEKKETPGAKQPAEADKEKDKEKKA